MSRINERRRQLEQDLGSEHLYASRVRVYPKAVHGPMRRIKWAVLAFCLTVYYLLPWLRWDRGAGRPDQAVLLDVATAALLPLRTGVLAAGHLLPDRAADRRRGGAVPGHLAVRPGVVRLFLPADGVDRSVHVGRAGDRGRPQRTHEARRRTGGFRQGLAQDGEAHGLVRLRVLDRRRLDHVFRRRADDHPRILDRHRAGAGLFLHRPVHRSPPTSSPAGRASRCAPTCAPGRASSPRCWTTRA